MVFEFDRGMWIKHNFFKGKSAIKLIIAVVASVLMTEGAGIAVVYSFKTEINMAAAMVLVAVIVIVFDICIYMRIMNEKIIAKQKVKKKSLTSGKLDKYVANNLRKNYSYVSVLPETRELMYRDVVTDSFGQGKISTFGMGYYHKEVDYKVTEITGVKRERNGLVITGNVLAKYTVLRKGVLTDRPYTAELNTRMNTMSVLRIPFEFKKVRELESVIVGWKENSI
jgi:hypothetical protein